MASSSTSASSSALNKRLFVGGLAESADEYSLIKFLGKHGKIAKFDYLFHKSGPKRGRPRGYAFVEYATPEEALKTMIELDGKLFMGRRLGIKTANEAPAEYATTSGPGAWRNNAGKHTTLSVLKGHTKPESRTSKISALEAKLQALEAEKVASASASTSRQGSVSEAEQLSDTAGTAEPEAEAESKAKVEAVDVKPSSSAKADRTEPVGHDTPTTLVGHASLPSRVAPTSASSSSTDLARGLPTKPNQITIATGEKERRNFQAREQKASEPQHRDRRDKYQKQEPVKSTLASLGASMGGR